MCEDADGTGDLVRSCRVGLCGPSTVGAPSSVRSEVSGLLFWLISTSGWVISTSRCSGVLGVRSESVVACVVLDRGRSCGRVGCDGVRIAGAPGGAGGAGGAVGAVGVWSSSSEMTVSSGLIVWS